MENMENHSQSHKAPPAIWDQCQLSPDTDELCLTIVKQACTWFTYPRGMEGWVHLGGWLYTGTKMVQSNTHS